MSIRWRIDDASLPISFLEGGEGEGVYSSMIGHLTDKEVYQQCSLAYVSDERTEKRSLKEWNCRRSKVSDPSADVSFMSHVAFCIASVELLDMPDEILLMIMRQVKPLVELLTSFIGVGNARLENLVLDRSRCSSIDITFDFQCSPRKMIVDRFFSHVMPCIYNYIESLTLNFNHLPCVSVIAFSTPERHFPNLAQLKIIRGRRVPGSGTPKITSNYSMMFLLCSACPSRIFRRQ
jgi:hypothetical protein